MTNRLLPFEESLRVVLKAAPPPRTVDVPLPRAGGKVLARTVRADRDLPPFDRAALDGYAVCTSGPFGDRQVLPIVGEIAAGERGPRRLRPDTCVRIWTGAMVPAGAGGIVPVERAREAQRRAVLGGPLASSESRRQGIANRGEDARRGKVLLARGRKISIGDLAVLGAVGVASVPVFAEPEVAVLVTGHELVPPEIRPSAVQIRSTNERTVAAIAESVGVGRIRFLGIVEDDPAPLRRAIRRGLASDILVVTGGISMGRLDLVPELLREERVRIHFHKVAIRPGKPLLFGTFTRSGRRTTVFGLPGNPVSVHVTSLEYLAPFLRAWRGESRPEERSVPAAIEAPIRRGAGLLHFVPCTLRIDAKGTVRAREIPTHGSGDFVSTSRAQGFLRVPGDGVERAAGSILQVDPLPGSLAMEEES